MTRKEDNRRPTPEPSLSSALEGYESKPHTPEFLTATFQAIWKEREARVTDLLGKPLAPVVTCDRSSDQIAVLERVGRRLGYLPPELATQESRHILGVIFPDMQSHSVKEENKVTNEQVRSGWFDYEATTDAPYAGTTEDQLRESLEGKGRSGMNVTEYILAGQDHKLLTGRYLDEGPRYVRLLGSRETDRVVYAHFLSNGLLRVYANLPSHRQRADLGGRSVRVK